MSIIACKSDVLKMVEAGTPCERLRRPSGQRAFISDERAVARARQKSRVDQSAEHGVACWLIKPPQTTSLLGRQPQTRHFKIFPTDATDNLMNASICVGHESPRFQCLGNHVHTRCQIRDPMNSCEPSQLPSPRVLQLFG